MKQDFDWQIDIEDDEWGEPNKKKPRRKRPFNPAWFMIIATIVTIGVVGGWFAGQQQLEKSEATLRDSVQTLLDLEHEALLKGDGDFYFGRMADDPAWRAAQLRPENLNAARAGFTVTRAQTNGDFIWANVVWEEYGRSYQRIAFFQQQNGQLQHVTKDPDYWGNTLNAAQSWGNLAFSEIDEPFAKEIAITIDDLIDELCSETCKNNDFSLDFIIASDYLHNTSPNTIYLPSPRLLALDETASLGHAIIVTCVMQ